MKIAKTEVSRQSLSREPAFDPYPDSDEHHYFVAGYTEGGFAFGITWEDAEAAGYLANHEKNERPSAAADIATLKDESDFSWGSFQSRPDEMLPTRKM